MYFTKEQLSSVMSKHAERENGLQDLMEIMLENMMLSERREYLDDYPDNKGNGFRQGRSYGQGRGDGARQRVVGLTVRLDKLVVVINVPVCQALLRIVRKLLFKRSILTVFKIAALGELVGLVDDTRSGNACCKATGIVAVGCFA
jgi:hypothetical protein